MVCVLPRSTLRTEIFIFQNAKRSDHRNYLHWHSQRTTLSPRESYVNNITALSLLWCPSADGYYTSMIMPTHILHYFLNFSFLLWLTSRYTLSEYPWNPSARAYGHGQSKHVLCVTGNILLYIFPYFSVLLVFKPIKQTDMPLYWIILLMKTNNTFKCFRTVCSIC